MNSANELCLPGTSPVLRPTRLPLLGVGLATGAARHNLFDAHGTLYACGQGQSGQLGNGTTTNSAVPVPVPLPASVTQVFQGGSTADNGQTMALLANGQLWAWGSGTFGQLGTGTFVSTAVPVQVPFPAGVRVVVNSGGYASYAIDATGELWAWGRNAERQLGTGAGPSRASPVKVGLDAGQVSSTADNVAALHHA